MTYQRINNNLGLTTIPVFVLVVIRRIYLGVIVIIIDELNNDHRGSSRTSVSCYYIPLLKIHYITLHYETMT